jgi:hypothetical protein
LDARGRLSFLLLFTGRHGFTIRRALAPPVDASRFPQEILGLALSITPLAIKSESVRHVQGGLYEPSPMSLNPGTTTSDCKLQVDVVSQMKGVKSYEVRKRPKAPLSLSSLDPFIESNMRTQSIFAVLRPAAPAFATSPDTRKAYNGFAHKQTIVAIFFQLRP